MYVFICKRALCYDCYVRVVYVCICVCVCVCVYMCASEHNLSIDIKIFKNPFILTPPIIKIHQLLDS
jgi:hypothetical protein